MTNQPKNLATRVQSTLGHMVTQFKSTLPAHIAPEKFLRAAVTAIQNTPDLQEADHDSIIASCQKAAVDGLLLDGREAALVVFNSKQPDGTWIKKAQYMPMVSGIMKKARNSGEIATITAKVVYKNDTFDYWIDENGEHFKYLPCDGDEGEMVKAFAVAKLKDGSVQIEVLKKSKIERIRQSSKSGSDSNGNPKGIWKKWPDEMWKKTALKQLCKYLPSSSDLDDVIKYDNDNFGLDLTPDAKAPTATDLSGKRETVAASVVKGQPQAGEVVDKQTGEVTDGATEYAEYSEMNDDSPI